LTRKEAARLFHKAVNLQRGIGGTPNPVKARELYFRAARAGDTHAMQNLGVMLLAGAGVPADPVEGYHWIRSGADAGDPKALFSCALLLRQGVGTTKDPALASSMMQRSAELGYVPALVSVADDSLSGENGATKDPNRAAELLLRAAKAGHDGAALRLSDLYKNGTGFPKDPAKSDEWLSTAARLGNAHAQFLYAHKMVVLKGPEEAYPWIKLAKDAGYVAAIGMYYEITGLMTPEQISRGDKQAAAIKAAYPPVAQ
jgi:TPR repeat protein